MVFVGSGIVISTSDETSISGLPLPFSSCMAPAEEFSVSQLMLVRCTSVTSSDEFALLFLFRFDAFDVSDNSVGDGVAAGETFGICNFEHGGKLLGSK